MEANAKLKKRRSDFAVLHPVDSGIAAKEQPKAC
jgi:hypothetical protein